MPLVESLGIVKKIQVQLQLALGNDVRKVYNKFETVLNKNNRLRTLKQISKILGGEYIDMDGLTKNLAINNLISYKFASITSVDKERSFSIYTSLSINLFAFVITSRFSIYV